MQLSLPLASNCLFPDGSTAPPIGRTIAKYTLYILLCLYVGRNPFILCYCSNSGIISGEYQGDIAMKMVQEIAQMADAALNIITVTVCQ